MSDGTAAAIQKDSQQQTIAAVQQKTFIVFGHGAYRNQRRKRNHRLKRIQRLQHKRNLATCAYATSAWKIHLIVTPQKWPYSYRAGHYQIYQFYQSPKSCFLTSTLHRPSNQNKCNNYIYSEGTAPASRQCERPSLYRPWPSRWSSRFCP